MDDYIIHCGQTTLPIKIEYKDATAYSRCNKYDETVTKAAFKWHQIVIAHKGYYLDGEGRKRILLKALFEAVEDEEFYPVCYTLGDVNDSFLIRNCKAAIDKLFLKNLKISVDNGPTVRLKIYFNVATYTYGQISHQTMISRALTRLLNTMGNYQNMRGILDLSNFCDNKEFEHIAIDLGNAGVFKKIINDIVNDENYRQINGLILRNNNIKMISPLKQITTKLKLLDLSNNSIRGLKMFCLDACHIYAENLMLAGNHITRKSRYTYFLKKGSLKSNFKFIDNVPFDKLGKTNTALNYEVDAQCNGFRIDSSNKMYASTFSSSLDWHAIHIVDTQGEFSKNSIIDGIFNIISEDFSAFYPCYYKYASKEHRFIIRDCFDQILYMIENSNFNVCVTTSEIEGDDFDMVYKRTLPFYFRMNVIPFERNQLNAKERISNIVDTCFLPMNSTLDLTEFKNNKGFENIIINLNSVKVLKGILNYVGKKFLNKCTVIILSRNNIKHIPVCKSLKLLTNVDSIDLSKNAIKKFSDIKNLSTVISIKNLSLIGNPICQEYKIGSLYINEATKIFKDLSILDGYDISKYSNPITKENYIGDINTYELTQQFLNFYLSNYESNNRANLVNIYCANASLRFNFHITEKDLPPSKLKYLETYRIAASHKDLNNDDSAGYFSGSNKIITILTKFNKTSHYLLKIKTTIQCYEKSKIYSVHVTGVQREELPEVSDIALGFSRQFSLKEFKCNVGPLQGGTQYKIINENFSIFMPTEYQLKNSFKFLLNNCLPNFITLRDKESIIAIFRSITCLNAMWSHRILEDADWDFKTSLELFTEYVDEQKVPLSAYE